MASTLYISLPSRSAADNAPDWARQPLAFALMSAEGKPLQQGRKTLDELKLLTADVRQLSLLLAACDVSLLNVKVPPMSAVKFKSALPNLLEEQMVGDPADAVLVATAVVDGQSTVAVADRSWLESLALLVKDWPVKKIALYPAQLALRFDGEAAGATAVIDEDSTGTELCIRSAARSGMGLNLAPGDHVQALQMLALLAPQTPLNVYVAAAGLEAYRQAAQQQLFGDRLSLQALDWPVRVAGLDLQTPDLMSGLDASHKAAFDWGVWRWPLGLAAAALVVNLAGLNFEWFTLKREARNLSDALTQSYRNSFPKETVILDPVAQMQQKIGQSRRLAGQAAPDDFVVLAAQFSQVWDRVAAGRNDLIASVEYKERSLLVKTKSPGAVPLDQLRSALAEQALTLASGNDGVLQIKTGGKRP